MKDGVGGGSGSQLRSALQTAGDRLKGCTVDQSTAADLVTRLQAMRRVTNVTLESSETTGDITEAAGSSDAGASSDSGDGGGGCSLKAPYYTFTITVFYAPGNATTSDAVGSTPTGGTAVNATTPTTAGK